MPLGTSGVSLVWSRSAGSQSDWFLLKDHRPVFRMGGGLPRDFFVIIFLMIFEACFELVFGAVWVPKWLPEPIKKPQERVFETDVQKTKVFDKILGRFFFDFSLIFKTFF